MMKRMNSLNSSYSDSYLNSGAFDGSLFASNILFSEITSFGMNHS